MFCMYSLSIEIYILLYIIIYVEQKIIWNIIIYVEVESLLDLESSENSNCYIRCSLIGFRVELKLELYIEYSSE